MITGNAGNNTLIAGSGNDTLIAGIGIATLVGGIGNDTFVINNIADVIQAQSTGTNINTVQTSVSYVTPANVQNITGTGAAALTLTGNSLNNTLTANNGNDSLIAGAGVATLIGGAGNDTFWSITWRMLFWHNPLGLTSIPSSLLLVMLHPPMSLKSF